MVIVGKPKRIVLAFASVAALVVMASYANAALPPGYEDEMWCPEGYCDRDKEQSPGLVGPVSLFHECYDPSSNSIEEAVWTGSLTDTMAPEGWVSNPVRCDSIVNKNQILCIKGTP